MPMNRAGFARSALTSAALSILFLVVYSGCNILTSHRADVGMIAFDWERSIPFVPLMIVPYLSIDLFFVLSPFLCRSDDERRRLATRIALAVLVAAAFFLLFPLRFAFPRPPVGSDILGQAFAWFRSMDLPYNLAPSLHIALRTVLADHYHRHTRGVVRVAMHAWFSLIGLSTLLVWQHHVVDVFAGFVLGGFCLLAASEPAQRSPVQPNRRVAAYYAGSALIILGCGWCLRPWGVLVVWPVLALALMATANLKSGPAVFRKSGGRLPLVSRMVLAPVLASQWLSLVHYRRHCRPWDEVAPGVWIGRVLSEEEAREAVARGVTAVLDLTAEFSEARAFLRDTRYLNSPVLDLTAPSQAQLRAMSDFIATEAARGVVLVHCKIGYSRSAAAIGAWLVASGQACSMADACARLRRCRPSIVIRPEVRAALAQFMAGLAPANTVS